MRALYALLGFVMMIIAVFSLFSGGLSVDCKLDLIAMLVCFGFAFNED